MQKDNFEKRKEMRVFSFNQRRPYFVDNIDALEGIVREVELVAHNLGLKVKRVYEGASFSLRNGEESAREEPFMVDRWALGTECGVKQAVTFVIRGEGEKADALRSWFATKQIESEPSSSESSEGNAEAYSFMVAPQVTINDPLDVY